MRTTKQDELAEKHGTPEQFEKAIWKAYSDLFLSHEEATSAIRRYQTEWNDASTGYAANAPDQARAGSPSPEADCSADDPRVYACDQCGRLRNKAEGGNIFTLCDECWGKHFKKPNAESEALT